MKKILITGGAGFVGTHLANKLVESKNYEVIVFDNTSLPFEQNISNFNNKLNNISFVRGDVRNKEDLRKSLNNVDIIIHLAAIVSVAVCEENPKLCEENNIQGTRNVFEIAKELNIKKIIYASSAAVYGDLSSSSITEEDLTVPISNYGISKLENEKTAKEFSNEISSIGLRFFNIYGPGLSMQNAYPSVLISFFKKIIQDQPIIVFGDGKQTRDFVHVFDVVQAIEKSIDNNVNGSEVYNVGTGNETEIISLAEKIKECDSKINIEFLPRRDFDILQSCADISKIKKDIAFSPTRKIIDDLPELLKLYTQ